jgi:hypothetical protein
LYIGFAIADAILVTTTIRTSGHVTVTTYSAVGSNKSLGTVTSITAYLLKARSIVGAGRAIALHDFFFTVDSSKALNTITNIAAW